MNKEWYKSKTMWGVILAIGTFLAQAYGVEMNQVVFDTLLGLGGILTVYGIRSAMK